MRVLTSVCLTYVRLCFTLKQRDTLSLFAFNSASVNAIREALAKQEGLELNENKGFYGSL